jgi:hypothetical protein
MWCFRRCQKNGSLPLGWSWKTVSQFQTTSVTPLVRRKYWLLQALNFCFPVNWAWQWSFVFRLVHVTCVPWFAKTFILRSESYSQSDHPECLQFLIPILLTFLRGMHWILIVFCFRMAANRKRFASVLLAFDLCWPWPWFGSGAGPYGGREGTGDQVLSSLRTVWQNVWAHWNQHQWKPIW